MTNKNKTTLYIGVTNDLCRRIYEHKNHLIKNSFTERYNLEYCIYYEEFPYFNLAINREKELKKWNRQKKEDLINKKNPQWNVLVTEHGFVRNEIPRFARNDGPPGVGIGGGGGGGGRAPPNPPPNTSTPSFLAYGCHSERSEESLNGEATLYSEQIEETAKAPVEAARHSQQSEESLALNDYNHVQQIPPCGRNDGSPDSGKGIELGGCAAQFYPSSPQKEDVIPNETKWREESAIAPFDVPSHSEQSEESKTQKGGDL
jgi:putative endonuclease